MTRTRRTAIDDGLHGNDWFNGSGSFVSFDDRGYESFYLGFFLNLGGNLIEDITLWNTGLLSLGRVTGEQVEFMASGASPIPSEGNPGFPGEFFLVDYDGGSSYNFYSYGIGQADYTDPYDFFDGAPAAFFTFESGFQIVIDFRGFSIISEGQNSSTTNGYFIGNASEIRVGLPIEVANFGDYFTFTGTAGADTMVGTTFADTFISSAGADTIDGLTGLDRGFSEARDMVSYLESPAGVSVNLATGVASGGDAQGDHLSNIEDLEGSRFDNTLVGNERDNTLYGNNGADTLVGAGGSDLLYGGSGNDNLSGGDADDLLDGGAGADTLNGGPGYDYLSYSFSPAGVTVSLADGTASGGDAAGDKIFNFEAIYGSQYNDVLRGSAGDDRLDGNFGNDTLVGLAGGDLLDGGFGNDVLVGGAGADSLLGGPDTDTISYEDSPAGLTVDLGDGTLSGGDATGDTINSIENVVGTAFADSITGDLSNNRLDGGAGNDTLAGRDGNDVLVGGTGSDTMGGGLGDDIFFVDAAGDVVTETANEGYDTIFSTVNFTLPANVERGLVDGVDQAFAINLIGNALANELAGNAGRNVLDGGAGADLMTGYAGDDVYFVDNAGDVIIEGVGAGFDTVFAIFDYRLGDNVERVVTLEPSSAASLKFTGNSLDNEMTGNAGANILDGGVGADLMIGGAGDDIYFVDNTGDVVSDAPGGGYDTVFTTTNFLLNSLIERVVALDNNSPTHVTLIGNEFANEITGSGGSNLIDGGLGADLLMGGTGGDAFRFSTALGSGNIDALPDFQVGTDKIYLDHAIFAALSAGSLTGAAFRAGTAAADADDRIIYDPITGKLYYDSDGSGSGAAVQFAVLHEGLNLSAGDFYVV